ncbi:Uncharacterised protein [Bartonella vinsonii]|uniref:Uncharacterized protein n=1 Tax=Bartonella vinsonii TaxID=33047 RepID=A0A3S4Z3V4_BARVI|nr:Uncharacterised protein [Bartonella vinsonii]
MRRVKDKFYGDFYKKMRFYFISVLANKGEGEIGHAVSFSCFYSNDILIFIILFLTVLKSVLLLYSSDGIEKEQKAENIDSYKAVSIRLTLTRPACIIRKNIF